MSSYFLLDLVPLSLALVLPECSGAGKDWDESLQKAQKLSFGKDKNCLGNQQKIALAIIELTRCFLVFFIPSPPPSIFSWSARLLMIHCLDYLLTFPTIFYPFCLLYPIFLLLSLKESLLEMFRSIVSVDDIQIFVYSNLSPFHSKNKHIKWNISHKINQTYSNWIFSRNCAH